MLFCMCFAEYSNNSLILRYKIKTGFDGFFSPDVKAFCQAMSGQFL